MNVDEINQLERAARLRREADFVLKQIRLPGILEQYGRVYPTGSYFLDVMIYPDIDFYLSWVSIEQLFQIGGEIAASNLVSEVIFQKSTLANVPGGLYLKTRVVYGDWGRPWKIDIWSLDEPLIEQKQMEMQRFKDKMTEALRARILAYKCAILTEQARTPMYSGYFIYKAFLDEGLADFTAVTRYLRSHGVKFR